MKVPYELVALVILEVIRSFRNASSEGMNIRDEDLRLESFPETEKRVLDRLTEMGYEITT